ncbi:MAG: thiol peroxidase [Prevotellaceae bacterium]|jgi:thiol peroxidase|nr:thiol peroxidase [Prevotellaceae bacterium]
MANITFKGNPVTLVGTEIKVGDKAPDFTVLANDLSEKHLSDYKGKVKIISLFPSIDTGVCATQTRTFNKLVSELSKDIVILCISNDLPFAQTRFCAAEGIDQVETLSDHRDVDFSTKYGFLIKELRLLARGAVVIDKNDNVRYVEYVPEVTNEPNYNAAIEVAKKLVM